MMENYSPVSGRVITKDGQVVNIVDVLGGGTPVSNRQYDIDQYAPHGGLILGEDGKAYDLVSLLKSKGAGGAGDASITHFKWDYTVNGVDELVFDNKSGVSTVSMTDTGLLFENNTTAEWAFVKTKESYELNKVEMRISFCVKNLPEYVNNGYAGLLILDDPNPNIIFTIDGVYSADTRYASKISDYVLSTDVDHVLSIQNHNVYVDDTPVCSFYASKPCQPVCVGGTCGVYIKSIEVLKVNTN